MRSYTLDEIDNMRAAIQERGFRLNPMGWRIDHGQIERQLRTYLQAGVSPMELYDQVAALPPCSAFHTGWRHPLTRTA